MIAKRKIVNATISLKKKEKKNLLCNCYLYDTKIILESRGLKKLILVFPTPLSFTILNKKHIYTLKLINCEQDMNHRELINKPFIIYFYSIC